MGIWSGVLRRKVVGWIKTWWAWGFLSVLLGLRVSEMGPFHFLPEKFGLNNFWADEKATAADYICPNIQDSTENVRLVNVLGDEMNKDIWNLVITIRLLIVPPFAWSLRSIYLLKKGLLGPLLLLISSFKFLVEWVLGYLIVFLDCVSPFLNAFVRVDMFSALTCWIQTTEGF